ncbi:programmed cell death 1 ligand 1-like isoform X1 [Chiloscyllium plagiosum]|uniref:programmed cell death 1 ligand 1-like isoform X1 n=1 Tax=Chiloscyllium plagiosum TaxID=36176 RepID=UPI001CB7C7CD|nr:programmed cell death 1 ligand 1-like isoform X1 [Chiloscyllium plagiosum]XP_043571188.1 programmed cell death 1 ligand 1-like isoform X1 [Chiloscyllium plagiosum]
MKTLSLLIVLGAHLPLVTGIFIVTAPRTSYIASYGNNITMECQFPVESNFNANQIKVYWHYVLDDGTSRLVYQLMNGKPVLEAQPQEYRERAFLLLDELRRGRAVLEINQVRVSDAGTYRCLIDLNGVDYKETALEVRASYKQIETIKTKEKKETEFVCQSIGYPLAEVIWYYANGSDINETANTTHFTGTDGLYNIRSVLRIKAETNDAYLCMFWNKELNMNTSAILHIKEVEKTDENFDKFPSMKRSYLIAAIVVPVTILLGFIMIVSCILKSKQSEQVVIDPMITPAETECEPP